MSWAAVPRSTFQGGGQEWQDQMGGEVTELWRPQAAEQTAGLPGPPSFPPSPPQATASSLPDPGSHSLTCEWPGTVYGNISCNCLSNK